MKVENTFLEGLKIIKFKSFYDDRGKFTKVFNEQLFKENLIATDIKESYFSVSQKGVIRGMHFQISPFEHSKLVYLVSGEILDVVLDIRHNSPTYGKFFSIKIKEEDSIVLHIPPGFAHGFQSLKDNTVVTYLQSSVYNSESDKGIHFNSFGMEWEGQDHIISERDLSFPRFEDSPKYFQE